MKSGSKFITLPVLLFLLLAQATQAFADGPPEIRRVDQAQTSPSIYKEYHIYPEGPSVHIVSPVEGFLTDNPQVTVVGSYENASSVTVNGIQAVLNQGLFTAENVPLSEGQNTLTANATSGSRHAYHAVHGTLDTIPPTLNMNPSIEERKAMTETDYQFTAQAEDSDPSPLEYQFELNGEVKQAYSPSNVFIYTPQETESGSKTLTVKAKDTGGEASQEIGIYVYRKPQE